jgi:hypothetical protein
MYFLTRLATALLLLAGVLVCLAMPACIDAVLMREDQPGQQKVIRDRAAETVEKYRKKYAGQPPEDWNETDREVYKNALRIRDELSRP